jgi:hypothetical protein
MLIIILDVFKILDLKYQTNYSSGVDLCGLVHVHASQHFSGLVDVFSVIELL